MFRTGTI